MTDVTHADKTKAYVDLAFKVLSVLVIPLLGWGTKLQVDLSVQAERIATLQKQVESVRGIEEKIASVNKDMAVYGEKLNSANTNLDTIRTLILRRQPPSDNP